MTPEQLIAHSPRLYHVTHADNLEAILRDGLLSTSAILDRCGVTGQQREALESRRRAESVSLPLPTGGHVTIRDQGPLVVKRLAAALTGGMAVADWLQLLNGRAYLFPDEQRWQHLAKTYARDPQVVLVFDTARLVARDGERMELANMNTGATVYDVKPRGPGTFKSIRDYLYDAHMRANGNRKARAIREITVVRGIEDVRAVLDDVRQIALPT